MKTKPIRINATDAGTIMGDNPWQGWLELWQIKTGRMDRPDLSDKESVQWGIKLEPIILRDLSRNLPFDIDVDAVNRWVESTEHGFPMTGRADYYDGQILIEIKTANQYALTDWEAGVPRHYLWQVMHYLIVTGLREATVACLVGGQRLIVHQVYYDEEMAKHLIEAERWFYELIVTDTEPPMPVIPEPQEMDMDVDVERLIPDYLEAKAKEKEFKRQADELADAIKVLVGENGTQTGQFYQASYKHIETNRLDSKALAEAEPDIYSRFVKTSGYYKLTIKEMR